MPHRQVVLLPKGSFKYNGQLLLRRGDGVVLRGSGVKETMLADAVTPGASHEVFIRNPAHDEGFANVPKYNLTGDYRGGESNLTTATRHAFAVGGFIWIDQKTNHIGAEGYFPHVDQHHSSPQTAMLAGSVKLAPERSRGAALWRDDAHGRRLKRRPLLVIQPPLMGWFAKSNAPQIMKMTGIIQRSGIESMTITNTPNAVNPYTIQIAGTHQFWLRDVELRCSAKRHVYFINSLLQTHIERTDMKEGRFLRCEVRQRRQLRSRHRVHESSSATILLLPHRGQYFLALSFRACARRSKHRRRGRLQLRDQRHVPECLLRAAGGRISRGASAPDSVGRKRFREWEVHGGRRAGQWQRLDALSQSHLARSLQCRREAEQFHHCIDIWARQHYWNVVGNVVGETNWHDCMDHPDGGSVQDGGGKLSGQRFGIRDANTPHYDGHDTFVTNTIMFEGELLLRESRALQGLRQRHTARTGHWPEAP